MSSDLKQKKEKRVVFFMTLACVAAIIIPFFSWWPQTKWNIESSLGWLLRIVWIILFAAFSYYTKKNFKHAAEGETDTNGPRLLTVLIAVCLFLWVAGWAAYANELIK